MDRNRILELAIAELERQKAGIERDIEALRAELGGTESSAARQKELAPSVGARRRRTPAERRAQAKRMKEFWAKKRAQAVKPLSVAKTPARGAKVRMWTDAKKKALSLKMKAAWRKRKAAAAKKAQSKATKAPE